jgi:hypothetical protein
MTNKIHKPNLNDFDFLFIVVSKDEVRTRNISNVLATLKRLLESPSVAQSFRERVDISFDGYNDDTRELYEIEEVREFVHALDDGFPFWLYFLSKHHHGLLVVLHCFLSPYLTDDARKRIHPQQLDDYLNKRGFPALNQLCAYTESSEEDIEQMTNRLVWYIRFGKLPTEHEEV